VPTVASVSPANGATRVLNDQPVQVELTRSDSTDYVKIETTQGDFAAGTLVSVVARVTNDLALATGDFVDNFDSDTIGQLPSGWDMQYGTGFTVQTGMTNKAVKFNGTATGRNVLRWTAKGQVADVDLKSQWKLDTLASYPGICARVSGAYGTETFYFLQCMGDGSTFKLQKFVNGTLTQLGSTISFSYSAGTVYWWRLQAIGTAIKAKLWADGSGEPGGWNVSVTDNAITAAGYVGVYGYAPAGSSWVDIFTMIGADGSTYASSGSRISPAYALSTVGKFGTGIVQFDTTLPANTTLTFKISKDGTTWTTVASGDRIALWSEGDNLASENIYTQALLATSDTTVTPVLSEVRLIFMAMDSSLVEITVDGLSFKVSSGNLDVWHTAKVTAGPVIVDPCRQDLFFATRGQWYAYGGRSYTVLVKYAGSTISTTTFTNEALETYRAWLPFSFMTSVGNGIYDGPMSGWAKYIVGGIEDYLFRGEFHYLIAEIPRGAMDARYWVAHAFALDTPTSGIVGQPVPTDMPLSGVISGWLLGDTPASGILQGWMRADSPISGIVASLISHDEAASGIVGLAIETSGALSGVVYEVNDRNAIELRVISVEEAQALAALGIVIQ
jgi:hypothetical protein